MSPPWPRLLALDLDGTLLRTDHRVADEDVRAIADLRGRGVTVTIATGRLYAGSAATARAVGIDGVIACMEGSHLVDVGRDHTVIRHGLDAAAAPALRAVLAGHDLASFLFEHDHVHHDERGAPYAAYVQTWSPSLRLVDDALDHPAWDAAPLAAVAIGEPDVVAAALAALAPHPALRVVSFAVSAAPGKHAVLARRAGPSKGTALAELCALAGCTVADAVVVGDWVNDLPMFEVAGRSFVMAGAPDDVAAAATDRLTSVTGAGGGVAEAIRRAWG